MQGISVPSPESRVPSLISRQGSRSSGCFGSNTSQKASVCQKAGGNLPQLLPKVAPFSWRHSPRAKVNYTNTNKSPQLVFAAATIAGSLQLFALPGLTIESQKNSSQRGRADNVEIMYAQNNLNNSSQVTKNPDVCDSLECKYLEIFSLILSIISLCLSGINLCLINKVIKKLEKEVEQGKEKMGKINKISGEFIDKGT